jgi:hypothetical protein
VQRALLVGQAMLGEVLGNHAVRRHEPRLAPDKPMPRALDYFSLRFSLDRR